MSRRSPTSCGAEGTVRVTRPKPDVPWSRLLLERAGAGSGPSVRWWNEPSFRVLDKLGFERTAQRVTDDFGDMQWCTHALR